MKTLLKICLSFVGFSVLFVSCKTPSPFTEAEKAIIVSGTVEIPFRVLQIADKQDSMVLRTPCSDVQNFANDTVFHLLVERLKTTLREKNGVGIAAPQVGISKNLFLFMRLDLPGEPVVVAVNPKILAHPDTTVCFERDGCLSIPNRSGNSIRYPWVDVEYWDEDGVIIRERLEGYSRVDGFVGVIFQHEFDHLGGVLFLDRLCE
jgi:peptide deformylase